MTKKESEKPESTETEVVSEKAIQIQHMDPDGLGDYSGAVAKTDEAEIALCRKLDRRVLPVLWAMYYLYVLCSSNIALSILMGIASATI